MLLSQTAQYALRAMAWLAGASEGEPVGTRELSAGTGIPGHYLSKVLRRLVLAGLLLSQKGQGGGFSLARPAQRITFGEILDAVDALPSPGRCAFGWGACNADDPCPLHSTWSELSDAVVKWAATTTLASVGEIPRDMSLGERRSKSGLAGPESPSG